MLQLKHCTRQEIDDLIALVEETFNVRETIECEGVKVKVVRCDLTPQVDLLWRMVNAFDAEHTKVTVTQLSLF